MQTKSLAALAGAVMLVAGPSMVLAQVGPPEDVPPEETPPVTFLQEEVTEDPTDDPTEEITEEATEEATEAELESEDDGHGELISALAECLPSGAELHGTGITKGFVISQVASTGTFAPSDSDEEPTPVESVEDAEALCLEVQTLADESEADETAKGRPDWAGPKDESDTDGEVQSQEDGDGGPPEHAGPPADRGGGPPDHAGGGS